MNFGVCFKKERAPSFGALYIISIARKSPLVKLPLIVKMMYSSYNSFVSDWLVAKETLGGAIQCVAPSGKPVAS